MQNEIPKISCFVITLNEGRYLDEVLESVRGVDEIVVVDSGSTDDTLEIAKRHGARIIHNDWPGYSKQKAFALEQCTHNWVINLDGDEVLPPGGFEMIQQRIAQGDINGIWVAHDDIFMGHSLRAARHHKYRRVYRKDKAHMNTAVLVHEHIEVEPPLAELPIRFKHYGYDSAHGYMDKLNTYSLLKAKQREEQGRGCSLPRLLLIYPLMFLKFYLGRQMIWSGWRGFIKANIDAFHFFLTEAKLYEREYRRKRGDDISRSEG
ncbi:Glycosyltransferase involved in cell wall bisynthesis [Pseudidiomarina planktonica]|uniref:Glycosyltransferase involved in cell wall bisynthesis n=1 Tax=Pseudidiomarina planktonica TaxID=1323738 RepID=A0A1Y6EG43_9GAMM|nr:glycosyltransferase family 2 protein [Pseudidiomarina planktonica]SMQ61349.1 Glycosyltransferase involved in cell wall bisynthesis [Pseudidiomarina planktonica]